jgi:hypothetical protein
MNLRLGHTLKAAVFLEFTSDRAPTFTATTCWMYMRPSNSWLAKRCSSTTRLCQFVKALEEDNAEKALLGRTSPLVTRKRGILDVASLQRLLPVSDTPVPNLVF